MFASGSASCGPSNPLQNFGKHVDETSNAQRERFVPNQQQQQPSFRTTSNPQAREHVNNDFQAFQNGAGPSMAPMGPMHQQHQHQHQQQQMQPQNDWAADFAKLSMNSTPTPQLAHSPAPQMHNQHRPQFINDWRQEFFNQVDVQPPHHQPNNLASFATTPNIAQQTEHRQQHHLHASHEAEMKAFEDAFDQVQQSLDEQERDELEKAAEVEQGEGEDLSNVAKVIVSAVEGSNAMSEHTTQKLQNSNFMNLMRQISEKRVVLEGEKFVDQSGSDVGTVESAKRQEEVPAQQQQAAPRQPPLQHDPEQLRQELRENVTTSQPSHVEENRLPDPFVYMEKEGVLSSFLAAQELGPQGLAKGSEWEEDYEQWAQQGHNTN